jgi:uncharacterized protein
MRLLITGSSGLVGTALTQKLVQEGHTVVRLVRSGSGQEKEKKAAEVAKSSSTETNKQAGAGSILNVGWNPQACDLEGAPFGDNRKLVEGADAVVNLAGASIAGQRWSAERKALLRSSRVQFTRELVCALEKLNVPPKTLISASAIGYYGDRGDEVLTEESQPGDGFLGLLAQEWEAEAVKAETFGMRAVPVRFGVILAREGGALPQMMRPFQYGVGGRTGSGQQWMSWITLGDAVRVICYALEATEISGAVNAAAPEPVRNADFARELGRIMHRPALLPAPAFALKFALGEMADALLLASQRVMPARLEQCGFRFLHPQLGPALQAVLGRAG